MHIIQEVVSLTLNKEIDLYAFFCFNILYQLFYKKIERVKKSLKK